MVRAAVMVSPKKPLEVQEFPMPEVKPGSILMKMEAAGVCGTDVHIWHGDLKGVPYPIIPGHENIGTVYKLGEGIQTDFVGNPLSEGDRITYAGAVSCGRCYYCLVLNQPTKCLNRRVYGIGMSCKNSPHLFGGFAEYVYLEPWIPVFKVPHNISTDVFIAFGCAAPTMTHGTEVVSVERGEDVVIQGSGPVGLYTIILARESGARRIIVIGAPERRLEYAQELGADHTINIQEVTVPKERVKTVKKLTDGRGADVVYECAGVPSAFAEGLQMLRNCGRYLEMGHYTDHGSIPINPHDIAKKQIEIYGMWGWGPKQLYKTLKTLQVIKDKYPITEAITHRFTLNETTKSLEAVQELETIKAIIETQRR